MRITSPLNGCHRTGVFGGVMSSLVDLVACNIIGNMLLTWVHGHRWMLFCWIFWNTSVWPFLLSPPLSVTNHVSIWRTAVIFLSQICCVCFWINANFLPLSPTIDRKKYSLTRRHVRINILITYKVLFICTPASNVVIFSWMVNTFIFSARQRNESMHSKLAVKVSAVTGSVTAHVADMLT
jgi:hypothetical protein